MARPSRNSGSRGCRGRSRGDLGPAPADGQSTSKARRAGLGEARASERGRELHGAGSGQRADGRERSGAGDGSGVERSGARRGPHGGAQGRRAALLSRDGRDGVRAGEGTGGTE